jgi:hypothetical protein
MDDICAICLENTDDTCYQALCCKKPFHFKCLDKWFNIKNTCPLCRTEYSHMEDYKTDMEDYLETIQNINVKEIIDSCTESVTLYKYQFEELNLSTLVGVLEKTETLLNVMQDFYNDYQEYKGDRS